MLLKRWMGVSVALLLGGIASSQAQDRPINGSPAKSDETATATSPASTGPDVGSGTRPYMLPQAAKTTPTPVTQAQTPAAAPGAAAIPLPEPRGYVASPTISEVLSEPPLGPTPPEDVRLLDGLWGNNLQNLYGMRVFGWADMGYTYSSAGPGAITVQPRPNRFGNEYLFNQLYLAIEKPLNPNELSFGFRTDFFGGADAFLLLPKGFLKIEDSDRFGFDIRQLYVSAHLPILTDGGVDIKAGRQNTFIGYEPYAAPYRPFYSNDYQWFYSEDGSVFTGISANWHVTQQLDIVNAIYQGFNTFFTNRSGGPTYLGQVNYWLQPEKETLLTGTFIMGPEREPSISSGDMTFIVEMRVTEHWNRYLTQVVQSHFGWEEHGKSSGGYGQWYSLMNIFIYHLTCHLDTNMRVEWFDDQDGTRTGFNTAYEEVTLGVDYYPHTWLSIRPEIRGDFSDEPVFRRGRDHAQLTLAIDAIFKY